MNANVAVFAVLSALALMGGFGVVLFKSPVRAALSLVLNFFVLGLMYFTLGTQLIGISQIMVYAGAIMVLFLFVIMVLRADKETDKPQTSGWKSVASGAAVAAVALALIVQVAVPYMESKKIIGDSDYGRPQAIGYALFTQYVWPFEVVSILLLLGIVGSILLAKRRF